MAKKIHETVVFDVVGLSGELIGRHTPNIEKLAKQGERHSLVPVTPAVTCSVQSTFLTGLLPGEHGCVANGWYFRDLCEVWFWRQSNKLVAGEKIWETGRKLNSEFTCANLFWWYNMYSSANISATPRPMYPADGRKIPDVYTEPPSLRHELSEKLGCFPLFDFWGPRAGIASSRWIANSARMVFKKRRPSLTLVYLPHLDYNLQRLGPNHPNMARDLREIDEICGKLIEYFSAQEARIILLSEYAIEPVTGPVHINRILRELGFIRVREEMSTEKLDPGASRAFAVADHQIAHVYVKDEGDVLPVKKALEQCPGIEQVWGEEEKKYYGLSHPRSGELVALAAPNHWFSYYFWLNDDRAPDYARTVDIHRKPGYDPVELFLDPKIRFPGLKVAWKLAKKTLGFRSLFDVISLDANLVKGSHGRVGKDSAMPVFISSEKGKVEQSPVDATDVKKCILRHLFDTV